MTYSLADRRASLEDRRKKHLRRLKHQASTRPSTRTSGKPATRNDASRAAAIHEYVRRDKKEGDAFAEACIEHSLSIMDVAVDSFKDIDIMTWPEDDREAQDHFNEIQDEILEGAFASEKVENAISEAFVGVANEVLSRGRR